MEFYKKTTHTHTYTNGHEVVIKKTEFLKIDPTNFVEILLECKDQPFRFQEVLVGMFQEA